MTDKQYKTKSPAMRFWQELREALIHPVVFMLLLALGVAIGGVFVEDQGVRRLLVGLSIGLAGIGFGFGGLVGSAESKRQIDKVLESLTQLDEKVTRVLSHLEKYGSPSEKPPDGKE